MAKFNKINQMNFNSGFYKTKKIITIYIKKKLILTLLNLIKSYIKIYILFFG